jgi:carbon-monoxide dehydrogenase medium subunit
VKPAPFMLLVPETLDEAVGALAEHGADGKVLAGGQSLIPMMNMRLAQPAVLVDVSKIAGLSGVRFEGSLSIGAATSHRAVLNHPQVESAFPLIGEALRHVGHEAIRARGTFGGSIAHADPAAELPAVMLVLDAQMVVAGPVGERVVAADEFFVTYYTTDMDVDEVLTEVRLPARQPSVWAFGEVARRHGDFAMAGVAFAADLDGSGLVERARLAVFGVADTAVRVDVAEEALVGGRLDDVELVRAVAEMVGENVDFASDGHVSDTYRKEVSVALVRRALLDARKSWKD